jgi:hypothetical protein
VQSGALRVEGDREEDREALLAWCQSLVGPAAAQDTAGAPWSPGELCEQGEMFGKR